MKRFLFFTFFAVLLSTISLESEGCTNYIVTAGASADGSVMVSYAADSHTLYGELYYHPAMDYPKGAMCKIVDWDTGRPLGEIPQVRHTYSVVGNMNEYQVVIGETTFDGRTELKDSTALIDYGSLMYLALQRAKTAREAIKVMTGLVSEYGYASTGESFSIADKHEAWIMDMISKGPGRRGTVWVARRVPDGYVSGHANQSRITTFPQDDPENCLYAPDVISFAKKMGYYKGDDKNFSFCDAYDPINFEGARFCEIRVWSMFRKVDTAMDAYVDYVSGHNLKHRLPLWIKPDHKITLHEMMGFMRDHLEGTPFDMTKDLGAGPFGCPYRWRPLTWKVDSVEYINERATATQQTGFSFVAQCRSWLPDPVGGILWFGVDDAASTVYSPMYCSMTRVPESFADGNGDLLTYSDSSAFWTFNLVSNFCYLRYDYMIKDVQKVQNELETKYIANTPHVDSIALQYLKHNKKQAIAYLTDYSVNTGNGTVKRWKDLSHYLLVKYMDGNIKKEKDGKFLTNGYNQAAMPLQPGYPEWFLKDIVKQTHDKLEEVK